MQERGNNKKLYLKGRLLTYSRRRNMDGKKDWKSNVLFVDFEKLSVQGSWLGGEEKWRKTGAPTI